MKEIYLDNSATTMVLPQVAELMTKIYTRDYGNPSSMHHKGVEAEEHVLEAAKTIAGILKVTEKEIIFTSCGTESDNMAILGGAHAGERRGKHIITTAVEHPAVLRTVEALEKEGFEVTYLGTDTYGIVSLEELKKAIREDTILVSMMHVHNEIGSVMPIEAAGKMIKEINGNILFHVDAVQSFGKFRIYPKKMNIDMLSASAHKIHGPKGVGFLYLNEKVRIAPLILGGGQQGNMRSGTENVAGAAAMGLASKIIYEHLDEDVQRMYELKKYFIDKVESIDNVKVNGVRPENEQYGAPHVISLSVKDVRAEVLLHALEDKGIYVSAGSACSTHKKAASATLKAIGLESDLLDSTIRLSMSILNTKEEIDATLKALCDLVPQLRKFKPR